MIELNTLWQYITNTTHWGTETFESLLFCQLRLKEDKSLYSRKLSDFRVLSDGELVIIAEASRVAGTTQLPIDCFTEFDRRVRERYEVRSRDKRSSESVVEKYVELIALLDDIEQDRVLAFIRKNKRGKTAQYAFLTYCRRLGVLGKVEALRILFEADLDDDDAYDLATVGVRLACKEGIDLCLWKRNSKLQQVPLFLCYQALREGAPPSHAIIEAPDMEKLQQEEHELIGRRWDIIRFFHNVFFSSLAMELYSIENYSDRWWQDTAQNTWVEGFCFHLAKIAKDCGRQLRMGEGVPYSWVYQTVRAYPFPSSWDENNITTGLKNYAIRALVEIALDLHSLSRLKGGAVKVALNGIQQIVDSPYWNREVWLEHYIENRYPLLTDEAAEWMLDKEKDHLEHLVNELNERAAAYSRLAQIALLHGAKFEDRGKDFLRKATNCLIGYGNHKDMLLFDTLDIIESCHQLGTSYAREWLFQLAPMIDAITDFTDGDETGELPRQLAGVILTICPELFSSYYQHLNKGEHWHCAEGAFHIFLKQADLSDPIVQAIASTVVNSRDLKALKSRAEVGDQGARAVVEAQARFLGGISVTERDVSSNTPTFRSQESLREQPERSLFPTPEDYPPDQLQNYVHKIDKIGYSYRSDLMNQWFNYWCSRGYREQVLDAVLSVTSSNRYHLIFDHLLNQTFELYLSVRGRSAAYPWIVKTHQTQHGWSKLWAGEKEATKRLQRVAELYPEKWLDFIRDVAESEAGANRIGHIPVIGFELLVKFCLMVGQREAATKIAGAAVRATLERKADLILSTPDWVLTNEIA